MSKNMLRAFCRRRSAFYKEEALVYGNQRAYDLSGAAGGSLDGLRHAEGSLDGKGNTQLFRDADTEHASMPHQKPDRELASMPYQQPMKRWGSGNPWLLARFISMPSGAGASTAKALIGPSFIRHYGVVYHTQRSSSLACLPCAFLQSTAMERSAHVQSIHGSLYVRNMNVSGLSVCLNMLKTYSSSVEVKEQTNVGKEAANQNDAYVEQRTSSSINEVEEQANKGKEETNQEDVFSQMLEMMGLLVDGDISAAANELKEAQQEMLVYMRKCSHALFAVGAVHLTWGGMMFFALESPFDHAVLTEVCMSSLVICGLAYQLKQTMKPVEFLTNREEHRKMRIIFLSRQVSRMLGAFFQRGYGIAFVLSLTLTAHSISCVRFLM